MKTDIARTNLKTTPTDIVAAMIGASTVTLKGFDKPAMPPIWTRPGIVYVSAPIASDAVVQEVLGAKRKVRLIERASWVMLVVAIIALQYPIELLTSPAQPTAAISTNSWQITSVSEDGVVAKTGEHSYIVPVGSRLPNGERLLAVTPERNAYTTNSATVILQGKKQ